MLTRVLCGCTHCVSSMQLLSDLTLLLAQTSVTTLFSLLAANNQSSTKCVSLLAKELNDEIMRPFDYVHICCSYVLHASIVCTCTDKNYTLLQVC